MVVLKASPRAMGSMVLEISHRINSPSTAARAMVAEKVKAERRLMGGLDDIEFLDERSPSPLHDNFSLSQSFSRSHPLPWP